MQSLTRKGLSLLWENRLDNSMALCLVRSDGDLLVEQTWRMEDISVAESPLDFMEPGVYSFADMCTKMGYQSMGQLALWKWREYRMSKENP